MAMNIYPGVNKASGASGLTTVTYAIHLDTTRTVDNGEGVQIPDETWVEWYAFPAFDRGTVDVSKKAAGQTDNQYRNQLEDAYIAQCKQEARLLARQKAQTTRPRRLAEMGMPEVDNN